MFRLAANDAKDALLSMQTKTDYTSHMLDNGLI